ncbi:hypothetical protein [Pseudomarimonas arenosa]|uniref:Killing trait domain-containing protein n=1 Tax=Pseudomarimonas arenosa TaxID=2774145 RepID=A0AAW3ZS95_9GAMM|nr:hypothetical protein [Pseudomarimonas arenosa]MBD8527927.1 hypothetical protein [Pseudomarimonas arenosa]
MATEENTQQPPVVALNYGDRMIPLSIDSIHDDVGTDLNNALTAAAAVSNALFHRVSFMDAATCDAAEVQDLQALTLAGTMLSGLAQAFNDHLRNQS